MYILTKRVKAFIGDPAKTSRDTVEAVADLLKVDMEDLSEWERQEINLIPPEVHLENTHRFRMTRDRSATPLPFPSLPSSALLLPHHLPPRLRVVLIRTKF